MNPQLADQLFHLAIALTATIAGFMGGRIKGWIHSTLTIRWATGKLEEMNALFEKQLAERDHIIERYRKRDRELDEFLAEPVLVDAEFNDGKT